MNKKPQTKLNEHSLFFAGADADAASGAVGAVLFGVGVVSNEYRK